jgi:hypothetical protein
MRLQAVLPRSDVDALLNQLLPLKVSLGGQDDDDRFLLLRDPRGLTFVPGSGVSLSCTADLRWSVLGLTVPILLRQLSVLLTPQIATRSGGPALVFALAIEHADLAGVPAVVDAHLVERVNQALLERQVELGWEFAKTLTHAFALPALLANVRSFNLGVGQSSVDVVTDALVLSVELLTSVTRG